MGKTLPRCNNVTSAFKICHANAHARESHAQHALSAFRRPRAHGQIFCMKEFVVALLLKFLSHIRFFYLNYPLDQKHTEGCRGWRYFGSLWWRHSLWPTLFSIQQTKSTKQLPHPKRLTHPKRNPEEKKKAQGGDRCACEKKEKQTTTITSRLLSLLSHSFRQVTVPHPQEACLPGSSLKRKNEKENK